MDNSTVLLLVTNITQMALIACLMFPVTDIVTISKHIKQFYENLKSNITNPYYFAIAFMYIVIIGVFGIYSPIQTLFRLRIPKHIRPVRTPTESVQRIIEITNANRNYMLASFSLFFLLVIWRVLELIIFSARLHEFSDLMGNYNLVDIAISQQIDSNDFDQPLLTLVEEDTDEDDEDPAHWPLVVHLNSEETLLLKRFLEETPHAYAKIQHESLVIIPEQTEAGEDKRDSEDEGTSDLDPKHPEIRSSPKAADVTEMQKKENKKKLE